MLTLLAVGRLLWALLGTPALVTEPGLSGVYGYPGDDLAGGPLACTGKALQPTDLVCAHRTLPCGTTVLVENVRTKKIVACQVLDRGPYGARLPGGRFVIKKRARQPGTWRAVVDLSPAVARKLGVSGVEPVRLMYLRPSAASRKPAAKGDAPRG